MSRITFSLSGVLKVGVQQKWHYSARYGLEAGAFYPVPCWPSICK